MSRLPRFTLGAAMVLALMVPNILCPVAAQTLPQAAKAAAAAVGVTQPTGGNADPQPPVSDSLGRQTPNGTVIGFLSAAGRGDYERAAKYLDTRLPASRSQELAQQLKVLIDRGLTVDLDRISRNPEGARDERVGRDRELVGTIQGEAGELKVVLVRVRLANEAPVWLFSADTLRDVPAFHEAYQPSFLERLFPAAAKEGFTTRFGLLAWLVAAGLALLAFAVARALATTLCSAARPLVRRLVADNDARTRARAFVGPIQWFTFGIILRVLAGSLLTLNQRYLIGLVGTLVIITAVVWLIVVFGTAFVAGLTNRLERAGRTERIALVRLGGRLFEAAVVFVGALVFLRRVGLDVTPVLAGLGVGGIAVALASQKTLENLFGGIMVTGDSPVRIGNYCRVGSLAGTVEDIGLRSTRIRTLNRTVISIPNAEMAGTSIENFGARDKMYFAHTLSLRYETTAEQLRAVLDSTRRLLAADPRVEPATSRVRLIRFSPSGFDVECIAYVLTPEFDAFLVVQEDLLLRIVDVVASCGTALALPSQTLYVSKDQGPRT
jgi:MscS family membrane protein